MLTQHAGNDLWTCLNWNLCLLWMCQEFCRHKHILIIKTRISCLEHLIELLKWNILYMRMYIKMTKIEMLWFRKCFYLTWKPFSFASLCAAFVNSSIKSIFMADLIYILKHLTFGLMKDVRCKRVLCLNRRLKHDRFMVCPKHMMDWWVMFLFTLWVA